MKKDIESKIISLLPSKSLKWEIASSGYTPTEGALLHIIYKYGGISKRGLLKEFINECESLSVKEHAELAYSSLGLFGKKNFHCEGESECSMCDLVCLSHIDMLPFFPSFIKQGEIAKYSDAAWGRKRMNAYIFSFAFEESQKRDLYYAIPLMGNYDYSREDIVNYHMHLPAAEIEKTSREKLSKKEIEHAKILDDLFDRLKSRKGN